MSAPQLPVASEAHSKDVQRYFVSDDVLKGSGYMLPADEKERERLVSRGCDMIEKQLTEHVLV